MPPVETVLIVDDYPEALRVWGLYLRAAGFRVLTAADGITALACALQQHPAVVVLDIELPGLGGCDVAAALRAGPTTRDISLIAATGCVHPPQIEQVRQAGFDVVLLKPCEPDELVAEVRRLASRHPRQPGSGAAGPMPRSKHSG